MGTTKEVTKASEAKTKYTEAEMMARYEQYPFFLEKDRKAIEFLTKHPIPEILLK